LLFKIWIKVDGEKILTQNECPVKKKKKKKKKKDITSQMANKNHIMLVLLLTSCNVCFLDWDK
jgi:hypothetical protein